MPRDQSHRLASSGWINEMQSNSAAVDVRRALADAEAALEAAEEFGTIDLDRDQAWTRAGEHVPG